MEHQKWNVMKVQIHSKNKEVIITQKVIQMDPTANQNCRKRNWTKNLNRKRIIHSIRIVLNFLCHVFDYKVGCVLAMVVSILPHAEFGRNNHWEDASHFFNLKISKHASKLISNAFSPFLSIYVKSQERNLSELILRFHSDFENEINQTCEVS